MTLAVSISGVVYELSEDQVGAESWNEACVRICRGAELVVVAIDSDRLTGPAVAAALYELSDMQLGAICVLFESKRTIDVVIGVPQALPRIYKLIAGASAVGEGPDESWLCGRTTGRLVVRVEGTSGVIHLKPRCAHTVL